MPIYMLYRVTKIVAQDVCAQAQTQNIVERRKKRCRHRVYPLYPQG